MKILRYIFLIAISIAYGQEPRIIEPSINAQQYFNVRTATEDLHTGQVSMSIPLFNLESKGIKLPISIVFSEGGFTRPEDRIASNVGLGWSLLAGGVISHTVRDQRDSASNYKAWKSSPNYLSGKHNQAENEHDPPYFDNEFVKAMDHIHLDKEPDEFNYSFNGYSGKIVFKSDDTTNNTYTGILFPNITFKIERLPSGGYKITTDDGLKYFFEEGTSVSIEGSTASWFLTEIHAPQGGEISFEYDMDCYTKDSPYHSFGVTYCSRRIKKIIYDKGYVLFNSAPRSDISYNDPVKKSRRISSIELYDKNDQLIKGFELGNNGNEDSLVLNWLKQYDKNYNYLPPYTFEYETVPGPGPTSINGCGSPGFTCNKYSWASTPTPISIAHRRWSMEPIFWGWEEDDGYTHDYSLTSYGVNHYSFLLSKVDFPTGGYESYEYENHGYSAYGSNTEFSHSGQTTSPIQGKRIAKKEIVDGDGNSKVIEYWYCLHDEDYQRISSGSLTPSTNPRYNVKSSGVLINPSIKVSNMYKPIWNDYSNNWTEFYSGNHIRTRFVGIPHYTQVFPQNKLGKYHIYYKEVEEVFTSSSEEENGKNIYYFKEEVAVPAKNYIYLNYELFGTANFPASANTLIEIPNNLYGTNDGSIWRNTSFLAYPIGDFTEYDYLKGTVLKQVTLNSDGNIVKKIDNEYDSPYIEKQYGLIVHKFIDNEGSEDEENGVMSLNRYLISNYTKLFSYIRLDKTTVTDYFPDSGGSLQQEISYNYTAENYLRSVENKNSDGKIKTDYFHYPNDYSYSGDNIFGLKANNIISKPLDMRSYNDGEFISGTQTKYKIDGQPEALFVAEPRGTHFPKDATNPYTFPEKATYTYNNHLISQINLNDSHSSVYLWDATGNYVMAKIENTTYSAVGSLNGKVFSYNSETLYNEIKALVGDNAIISTYTHKQLVGITQKTDTRGYTTYYQYDDFNRLKVVKDAEGKILSENQYHYKGQQ
ncbi:hypothetical protein EYD45_07555 [Hyunsoonleella flava]|uniref:RHS repeat protein n=1 Tax=Hyunsoonleella flava TaxID=2527939 RepID=A0A4Q9FHV5_9FLAO|nr:RHS repeat domain-containing protein [Hyunsoonleella flava]TBN04463.1 hypothetical protein EYD45_07555 [Hyunsoonleella flava]